MQNKLLPCPFCGSDKLWVAERNYFGKQSATVNCLECGLTQMEGRYETMTEAIEHWNTREPMERIVEQLEKEMNIYDLLKPSWETRETRIAKYEGFCDGISKAIKIVKGGVDNE